MRKVFFIWSFASICGFMAQGQSQSGEIEDAEIIIEKDKPLQLPSASRLHQNYNIQTTDVLDTGTLRYSISNPSFTFKPLEYVLQPQKYEVSLQEVATNNFVQAGFGNYTSPLLVAGFSYTNDDVKTGAWLRHESFTRGPVRDDLSAFSTTDILLDAALRFNDIEVTPVLSYQRESYYFYGRADEDTFAVQDRVANNYVGLSIPGTWRSNKLILQVEPAISFINLGRTGESAQLSESAIGLGGDARYEFNKSLNGIISTAFTHYGFDGTGIQQRQLFTLTPAIRHSADNWGLYAGIKFSVASDSIESAKPYLHPQINAHYSINDQLKLTFDLTGGVLPTNLQDRLRANRYLSDSLRFINSNEKVDASISLTATVADDYVIQPYLSYGLIQNMAFFDMSAQDSSRYTIIYDRGDVGRVSIGVRGYYYTETARLSVDLYYNNYQTDQIEEALYLPSTGLLVQYDHRFSKSLRLNSSLNVMGGVMAQSPGADETEILDTVVDLSAGVTYAINDQFSVFASGDNLLNFQNEYYLNYPARGISGKIGFIYRF